MTIGIIISPIMVSPQSVELQYHQCYHQQQEEQCHASPIIKHSPSGDYYSYFKNSILPFMHQQQQQKLDNLYQERQPSSLSQLLTTITQAAENKNKDEKTMILTATTTSFEADSVIEQLDQHCRDKNDSDEHHLLSFSCSPPSTSSSSEFRKKSVQFNLGSLEMIIPHIHRNDMTDEDIRIRWFTVGELNQIRIDTIATRRFLRLQQELEQKIHFNATYIEKKRTEMKKKMKGNNKKGKHFESYVTHPSFNDNENVKTELCYRGLEGRQKRLIVIARHAVFAEQQRQKKQQQQVVAADDFEQKKQMIAKNGQNDLDRKKKLIATRYKSINEDAIIFARERGRQDASIVLKM
eukprot:CAMPEP_0194141166 /NCGR_PEP_ID=MMETSP0152-20130528/10640_1 /TAXON_ID=1049557 /ORGANISM="Thalassiothrix antarctica, Strain L6-D1" /LENGTH=350 /DNA_ID=CAMNT_0038839715 /DNA_START=189 /DNA_END=1241 /DNA_ORIENTATION=+